MEGLSWHWIGLQSVVPLVVALAVAYPLWRKNQMILGTVAATMVVCAAAIGLIFREHVVIDEFMKQCMDEGNLCVPHPSDFTRFAVYAFVAIFQVFALFLLSLFYEERVRRRDYAPEWR